MPKPKTGLTKKRSKATKSRARSARKLERKGRTPSLSTHGMGKETKTEERVLSAGLSGRKDISEKELYKIVVESQGQKMSLKQRKKSTKKY